MNGSWIYNRIGYHKRYPIFFLKGSWRKVAEAKKNRLGKDEKVKQEDLKKIEELIRTVKYGTVM